MRRDHGGNLRALARAAGIPEGQLLDFSASINPLGLSPRVEAAIKSAIPRVIHYPDPEAALLQSALASYHGLSSDCVLVGNGSTELIYLLARALAPRRALILHPAFSEYEAALELAGARIERLILAEASNFFPDLSTFGSNLAGHELVVLANPGNPTGSLFPAHDLQNLAAAAQEAGALLVVDEAFIDFAEEASLKRSLGRFPRLLLLRSLTKFFALPGLRIGYGLASPELLGRLRPWKEPWSVNALAGAAGAAALEDRGYQENSRSLIPSWREGLSTGLQKFAALQVFPGAANYLLVKLLDESWTARAFGSALLREGIAIRDCSSFPGLGPQFFRVAVRRPEENRILLGALEHFLGS